MKIKPIITFCIISSLFLFCLISIWKILATLQGNNLKEFNFTLIFTLGFLVSLTYLIIGNKVHHIIKSIILSLIFTIIDAYTVQSLPWWYSLAVFLILIFFTNKLKKYNKEFLYSEHSSEKALFDFATLFGITLFSFVILFPFYMMVVTSFKTQALLLLNPLDFSIDIKQGLKGLFKSYYIVFDQYKFGRYMLTSSIVSFGTVIVTLLFAIPAAYAVARLNFFGKTFLSTSILIIYMFPAIVLVIPLYTVFSQLGLRNSIEGLLIVYTATTLPVAIYMLQG